MNATQWIASTLFAAVYAALAFGRVPGLRLDRPAIAMIGAAGMIGFGVMNLHEAASSVDVDTIVLLFGMMIIVGYLRGAGWLDLAADHVVRRRPGPLALLAAVVALSGVLSAFLVNDVVCVALTPLVLDLCRRLGRPAVPYLIGLATASNVGSAATITGNPQNIIIGSLSGISYARFAARLGPVAVAGLVLVFLIVATVYRKRLSADVEVQVEEPAPPAPREAASRELLVRSGLVTLATVFLFFVGAPIASTALIAAAILMLDRVEPERAFSWVDWPLLVMFMGLFAVVHGFEEHVVRGWDLSHLVGSGSPVVPISLASVVLSNLVSNVPAVLLFKPVMAAVADQEQGWLALAMSSTLAGNLTLLGSVANLIVAECARREGEELGFAEYLKVGVPLTVATTALGIAWVALTHY